MLKASVVFTLGELCGNLLKCVSHSSGSVENYLHIMNTSSKMFLDENVEHEKII